MKSVSRLSSIALKVVLTLGLAVGLLVSAHQPALAGGSIKLDLDPWNDSIWRDLSNCGGDHGASFTSTFAPLSFQDAVPASSVVNQISVVLGGWQVCAGLQADDYTLSLAGIPISFDSDSVGPDPCNWYSCDLTILSTDLYTAGATDTYAPGLPGYVYAGSNSVAVSLASSKWLFNASVIVDYDVVNELILNGDFETGDLTSWDTNNLGAGSFVAHDGTTTPLSGLTGLLKGPLRGTEYSVSDSTTDMAGAVALLQTFTVPAESTGRIFLSFDLAVNDASGEGPLDAGGLDYTIANNQHARVDLLTAVAGDFSTNAASVVRNFYLDVDGTATENNPVEYTRYSFDVTDDLTRGTAYQLRFAAVYNKGRINMSVDRVSLAIDTLDACSLPDTYCPSGTLCIDEFGGSDAFRCDDIDECTLETDECGTNADCFNFYAGYYCTCADGFEGDPYSACVDINECDRGHAQCDLNATCNNAAGSFTCDCNTGWTGDGTTCANVDECTDGTDNCNGNAGCTDTVGGFICECNDGYTGDGVACAIQCGDNELGGTEECDDGNNANGDGCASDCTIEDGYECDERYGHPCGALCGDGLVALGAEDCDDGNGADWDGCDFACRIEEGWTCDDDGAGGSACDPICQDALVRGDEECDDGNRRDGDGCADCMIVQGYICDDAEPTTCVEDTECGNGYVSASEECDDGNTTEGDGCSEICTFEANWDCDGGQPTMCEPIFAPAPIDPLPSTGVQPGEGIRCSTTDLPGSTGWALLFAIGGLFVIRRRIARR